MSSTPLLAVPMAGLATLVARRKLSAMSLYPLKFKPRFVEKIWGGRKLETVLGKTLPPGKPIGENRLVRLIGEPSRFGDGLGISLVVLLRFDVRLDVLRWH